MVDKASSKRITIVIPDTLLKEARAHIDRRFGENSRAMSMVMRQALKEYLNKQ